MSESGLLARFKNLALQGRLPSAPQVKTVYPGMSPAGQSSGEDVLRSLSAQLGFNEHDVTKCYSSQDHYKWCIALLSDSPAPPSPFPSDLFELFLKAVGRGILTQDRIKSLGLENLLMNIVANRIRGVFERLRVRPDRQELADELERTKTLIEKVGKAMPVLPERVETMVRQLKNEMGVPVNEKLMVEAFKGKIEPSVAVEDIIKSVKGSATVREEKKIEEHKKEESPKTEQAVAQGRAQAPRGEV